MVKVSGICCNPFQKIGHQNFQRVCEINETMIARAAEQDIELKKNEYLCDSCRTHFYVKKPKMDTDEPTATNDPMEMDYESGSASGSASFEERKDIKKITNDLLSALGLNEINNNKFRGKSYQTELLAELSTKLIEQLFTLASTENIGDKVIKKLKDEFDRTTSRDMKIKILSVMPEKSSVESIQNIFGVSASKHMIKQTKKLVKDNGHILCDTTKKIGSKSIKQETIDNVIQFYRSDEISRPCPGLRDYVVKHDKNGERQQIQRRLVMMNLHEAFQMFKRDYPNDKIGFSKFAEIRPRECVLAGSTHGIHTTCVCEKHQNVKLIFDALKQIGMFKNATSYRDIITKLLCDIPTKDCHLNKCAQCSGIDAKGKRELCEYLYVEFEAQVIEKVRYKQWIKVGSGTKLGTVELEVDSFIDTFSDQLTILVQHDYIAKHQSAYLKKVKQELKEDEVIAIGDFSENLAFEIQDAAQSHYYSKTQCTLHPVCIYYKVGQDLKQKSIMIIAESLKHNVEAVYLFRTKLIGHLKEFFGDTFKNKKIKFFTDGAASQYKNKYNFVNLCLFKHDFEISAEWHFFATSHGKSACDAMGGSFKRNVRNHNMKHPTDALTNAYQLFEWARKNVESSFHFIYCTEKQYDDMYKKLNSERYNIPIKTVVGTQGFHCFKPINEYEIAVSVLSESTEHKIFKLIKQ